MGCTVGDYDNDGDDDLFVTGFHQTVLYRNRGDGTFEDVTRAAGVASDRSTTAAGFGDLDGDGDLDLVVVTYVFRNQGGLRFGEIGTEAGVATNGSGRATASMGVVADDLDGDGLIDLLVTNLVNESSTFYRNLGGGIARARVVVLPDQGPHVRSVAAESGRNRAAIPAVARHASCVGATPG